MNSKPQKMWQSPWCYRESVAAVAGIIIVGWLLQLSVGGIDMVYLSWPVNIILGALIVTLIILLSLRPKGKAFRWISGVPLSSCLIAALVILGIIMGLTPQHPVDAQATGKGVLRSLGFATMTSSWAFVLVYTLTLVSLGCVVVRRMMPFKISDYAFYLNHAGLWVLLFSAGMGAADTRRYVMHIREGEVEWRVYNDAGDVLELPVAIQLNDFDMEVYPPKLAVISRTTGVVLPEDRPQYHQIDEKRTEGTVGGRWRVTLENYIHNAVRNSDTTYREAFMPGAAPAAKIKVVNPFTGSTSSGWVCAGNLAQLYMVLNLDEEHCVVMTQPEPKRFLSDIDVFTEQGRHKHALLEVNKPARLGGWSLYQYGYDNDAGKMSTYSSIELVYDPWLMPVYAGILMLGAGSVCMLWSGKKRKGKDNVVE